MSKFIRNRQFVESQILKSFQKNYNSLFMDKQNLIYRWEVLQNVGSFLSLKDLLSTATLSKQFNFLLKKYLKNHFSLVNNQNHDQFQQLKALFNRKVFVYNPNDKFARQHPSNIILRHVEAGEKYSVVQTLDSQFMLAKTDSILIVKTIQLIPFPQKFNKVHIAQGNLLYCAYEQNLIRYNVTEQLFANAEILQVNGEVQNIVCGFKYSVALIRQKIDNLRLKIFDNNQPLTNGKDVQLPFQLLSLNISTQIAIGKLNCYFLYNQTLYDLNLKTGSCNQFAQFSGKKIVKIIGGKLHFLAYERTQDLSINWNTQDVVKFAQKEGLQDYIKIFKAQKVTGKILLQMNKKYMEEVLGILNQKNQQKLTIRLQECNKQNPQNYILYGWGRASEGALATNPSKEIVKPIKIKLPNDCQVLALSGLFTFLYNKKTRQTLINHIDEKTNKLQWKEVTSKKIWGLSVVGDNVIIIAAVQKQRIPKHQSETVIVQKKQKLRTAKNIIDKITWDQKLNAQQFKIGYLDKYDGILEVPFKQMQLAEIKEYRIEYFKQSSQIVWDKKKRIDIL